MPTWKLEKFWQENVAGTEAAEPDPKETYQQALENIRYSNCSIQRHWVSESNKPGIRRPLSDHTPLRRCHPHRRLATTVRPPPAAWCTKFNALIIDPPLFGHRHDTPVFFGLALMPKRGQALFVFYFIAINTVLSAVNYQYADPNTWYPGDGWRWMCMLISNRLGLLSFANLPLVFLIIYLDVYIKNGTHANESREPYWY
ncbi:hypothetical protein CGCVW01_v009156 [Colletotrichum viniferum]|nr:hypothetical protein CGCVW01_v009156 [Colletotrichum viniferum]